LIIVILNFRHRFRSAEVGQLD